MKMAVYLLAVALGTGAVAQAAEVDRFFCVADKSTGFKFQDDKWGYAQFDVSGSKYTIAPSARTPGAFDIYKFGEQYPLLEACSNHRNTGDIYLICGGANWGVIFNEGAMRYQYYYGLGYVAGRDAQSDTPFIEIGRCSRLP